MTLPSPLSLLLPSPPSIEGLAEEYDDVDDDDDEDDDVDDDEFEDEDEDDDDDDSDDDSDDKNADNAAAVDDDDDDISSAAAAGKMEESLIAMLLVLFEVVALLLVDDWADGVFSLGSNMAVEEVQTNCFTALRTSGSVEVTELLSIIIVFSCPSSLTGWLATQSKL